MSHKLVLKNWDIINGRQSLNVYEKLFESLEEAVAFLDGATVVYEIAEIFNDRDQLKHKRFRRHHDHHDGS